MMLVDKETGKGYVEMEKVHHDKKEYASKGVAGTALGLGIAGTALALFNNGFGGNLFGCRGAAADGAVAANNYICKINKFLQMIEEENGLIDIETLLGKSIDNLIVSPVQEYPDMFKGVTIGNGKIRIGLPGINKDIVLDANDIETFKQSLVK